MSSQSSAENNPATLSDSLLKETEASLDGFLPNINECFNQQKNSNSPESESKESNVSEQTSANQSKVLKNRKKDDSSVQHVLRALNSLTTPEEKLAAMCKKYADLFDENRKLQSNLKQYQKQITAAIKEKDQVRTDLAKSVLSRSRLESLCRELQRQNREIKEESFQKIREEEEKRKEVSAKFQVTLNEITNLMKQDSDKTMKLRDDNIDMTSKLKSIYEQYEIREQQIEKMAKQMALESQLYEAKIAKLEMEAATEKEMLLREKQQLLMTLSEYQTRFQEYQNIEMTLRNQVALYNSKYEEFEKSLTRSNKMFGGFKEEMETMSNKIVKLESETAAWKLRWEKTQKALIEMASEKQKSDQEIIIAAKQMATLHKLCRTLQAERTELLATLKQNNVPSYCSLSATSENSAVENLNAKNESTCSMKNENINKNSENSKNCNNSKEKTVKNIEITTITSKNHKTSCAVTNNINDDVPTNKAEYNTIHKNEDLVSCKNKKNTVETNLKKVQNKNDSRVLESHTPSDFIITASPGDIPNCSPSKAIIDSTEFVLKKSAHCSKRKISPKKKNKK